MNKYVKTFLGIIIVAVPVLIVLGVVFNNLSKRSFYPTSGEIAVSGLKSPVKLYFDDYGVPQIYASNEEDAYFTEGYVHARDRLWQMDLTRRVAEGRLSEIFGSTAIEFDKLFKTIGIYRFAYAWYGSLSPKSKEILTSYTLGINSFIESHYNNLPVEFDALNYKPEPWKPEHSLMLARMMAWDLNIAWYTDYILGEVLTKAGIEKTAAIFPDTNITIYIKPEPVESDTTQPEAVNMEGSNYLKEVSALGKGFFEMNEGYRKFLGINVSHTGSNSWVVSGSRSIYGKPILANDPHLALQSPSRWYELRIKGGELDLRGMTFPGIPGVVIGNNKYISWGLTNLMNDDNDFVILELDSADNGKYKYGKQVLAIDSIKEKIFVKDSVETDFVIRTTKIGPVVSDLRFRGFADMDSNPEDPYKDKLMTFRWTGFELSDEINCFYGINHAKNWDEFRIALKDFTAPAQNFIYSDIYGNIGYQAAGKVPIRKTASVNNFIFPSSEEVEWAGFVDFDKMPQLYNPKEGYIVTANTDPFGWMKDVKDKFYISYLWEPSSRFDRITKFIDSKTILDLDDYKLLQNSTESPYAKNITKDIYTDCYENSSPGNNDVVWAVERLRSWNGDMSPNESIGSVYNTYLVFLIKNTFSDELGENVFNDFLAIQNIPYRSLEIIMKDKNNPWFDNINTPKIETRSDIVKESIAQAIEFLRQKFPNRDINTWHWGEIHNVKFYHPLGIVEALDNTFNIGPFECGGDQTTVNNTEYRFSDVMKDGKYRVVVGASMRMLVNMADIEHPLTINSTGQSGQPVNDHYSDQARMWHFGEYKTNTMSEMEMIDKRYSLLNLLPR